MIAISDTVARSGCRRTSHLADGHQERPRQTGPSCELSEGLAGERGEDAIRRVIHEVEGQGAAADPPSEQLHRDAGRLELLDDSDPSDVTLGESILAIGLQDLELD